MFDFNSYLMAGRAGVQDRQAREAEQRTNKLAALAGDAFAAPPGAARDTALSTAMRLDPSAGVALQGAVRTDDDARNQSLANMARLLTTAPEPSRPGLYQQMRPSLQRLGVQAPEQYDATVAQTAQAIAQAFGSAQGGPNLSPRVQSLNFARENGYLTDEQYRQALLIDAELAPGAQAPGVTYVEQYDPRTGATYRVPQATRGFLYPGLGGAGQTGPMPAGGPPQQAPQAQAAPPAAVPQPSAPGSAAVNIVGLERESLEESIAMIEDELGRPLTAEERQYAYQQAQGSGGGAGGPPADAAAAPAAAPIPAAQPNPVAVAGTGAFAPLGQLGGGDGRIQSSPDRQDRLNTVRDEAAARVVGGEQGRQEAGPDFERETRLRTEFRNATAEPRDIVNAYNRVEGASRNPSAAGDLSMIFAYMKMLDPGSVVREGEFANAQNATGVPGQVVNLYNRALSGERLAPEQRADFLRQAATLRDDAQRRIDDASAYYADLAASYGSAPERITGRPRAQPAQPSALPPEDDVSDLLLLYGSNAQ